MKNVMFFVISLICVVVFAACSNDDNTIITSEEEVVFSNPMINVDGNQIVVSIEVSSSRGDERVVEALPIEYISDIYIFNTVHFDVRPEVTDVSSTLVSSKQKKTSCLSYEIEDYEVNITSSIGDDTIHNITNISIPNNISVTKYGKTFKFERIDFDYEVNTSFEKMYRSSYYNVYIDVKYEDKSVLNIIHENEINKIIMYY